MTHTWASAWDPPSLLVDQMSIWGQLGVTPAFGVRRLISRHALMSSSFFFSQFASSPRRFIRFQPNLVTSIYGWRATKVITWFDLKGYAGITGVKRGYFSKNASSPTHYMVWSWNSCIWTSSTVSTNLIKLNVNLRSFGVTGSNSEVKFQTTSNGKITSANMLV